MDKHISNDPFNPINWNGEHEYCECCEAILTSSDWDNMCVDCFEDMQNGAEEEGENINYAINSIKELNKLYPPELEEGENLK